MLTGVLPYDTPAPADLDKLMSGELVSPPRLKNPSIPKAVNDIVMRAMAPDVAARYPRASDLLEDVLAIRTAPKARQQSASPPAHPTPIGDGAAASRARDAQANRPGPGQQSRGRSEQAPKFCWQCRKPLHARSDRCPFCGEAQ
jgi:serine/threonine protein kinase